MEGVKVKEESVNCMAPDSTTIDKPCFSEGEDVLLHEAGFYYFGSIIQVDLANRKCLVQFGDDTDRWSSFRDLKKIKIEGTEICCVLCKKSQSFAENAILLCHYCGRGYHQSCHDPKIPKLFAVKEQLWMCTRCGDKGEDKTFKACSVKPAINLPSPPIKTSPPSQFPYQMNTLSWDAPHRSNSQHIYCYCAGPGDWYRRMLQCCHCLQWFHQRCVSCINHTLLFGDRFYLFLCAVCNHGTERIARLDMTVADVAHLVLYNLALETGKKYQDLDTDILPYLDSRRNELQLPVKITKMSAMERRNEILDAFKKYKGRFVSGREMKKKGSMWGLRTRVPPSVVFSPHANQLMETWLKARSVSQSKDCSLSNAVKKHADPAQSNRKIALKQKTERTNTRTPRSDTRASSPDCETDTSSLSVCSKRKASYNGIGDKGSSEESCGEGEKSCQSPRVKRTLRRKVSAPSSSKGSSGRSSDVHDSSVNPTPADSGDESCSRSTLDMFIPLLKDFEGQNNPFLHLDLMSMNSSSAYLSAGHHHSLLLQRVQPLKMRLSAKDIRITKNGEIRRRKPRPLKKNTQSPGVPLLTTGGVRSLANGDLFRNPGPTVSAGNGASSNGVPSNLSLQTCSSSMVQSVFGTANRIASGEKYTVVAKRVLPSGQIQYLLDWEPNPS